MAGDAALFVREDYVVEAWRIADPALKAGTPVCEYDPMSWGRQRPNLSHRRAAGKIGS
jgi:glucose-6-phosphate 1-dehydrogenase